MYEDFYKLECDPFQLRPRKSGCYEHGSYSKAKAYLTYAIEKGDGVLVVTGEPGSGKTTLVRDCIRNERNNVIEFVELSARPMTPAEFIRYLAVELGSNKDELDQVKLISDIKGAFIHRKRQGGMFVVLIDEAQVLDNSVLDEIKSFTNMEFDGDPIVQFILLGLPELMDKLKQQELEPLFQRVTGACNLAALKRTELGDYISACLDTCGWMGESPFKNSILDTVFRYSGGNPRRTNLIASRLLLHGRLNGLKCFGQEDIDHVLSELEEEGLFESTPL